MTYEIVVQTVPAEWMAAVRVAVPMGGAGGAWKPALDRVWAFLKTHGELRPGHNLFLYHHPARHGDPMTVDFGVQVPQAFARDGDVQCRETPAGEVASTVHVGPYDRLGAAHDAINAWCAANDRKIGSASWEIYGDWNADPALLETTVRYLLA